MAVPKTGRAPLADLAAFLEPFAQLVRRAESRYALERYTTGLLADVPKKNASALGRAVAGTNGQRLQEFLTRTAWDRAAMDRLRIALMLERATAGPGLLIVDDIGLAKKGEHSVGVVRQYSGTLGRTDNCQVVVTAHYVDRVFDWPVSARLYLPESWTLDPERCEGAQVPEGLPFRTKGEIALELVDLGRSAGLRARAAVADAGYGDQPAFLDGLEARGLPYAVGLKGSVRFRLAEAVDADGGERIRPPYHGRGRPRRAVGIEERIPTEEAAALLARQPSEAWQRVAWREGVKGALVKEFTRIRVYRAGRRSAHTESVGWLVGERPLPGHRGEAKQYFVWGLDDLSLEELVALAHQRWVVERFYQDAKGELGLDDYEGRFWTGLHRHLALVMLAHCYLTLRQSYGPEILRAPPEPAKREAERAPRRGRRGFPPTGPTQRGRAQARGA